MKAQSGDQWVNALGDSILAFDNGGEIGYRISFAYKPEYYGFAATLSLAKKAVKAIRQGAEGADDWTMFYTEPRIKR